MISICGTDWHLLPDFWGPSLSLFPQVFEVNTRAQEGAAGRGGYARRLSILGVPGLETPGDPWEGRVTEQVWAEAFVFQPPGRGGLQSAARARRVCPKPHKGVHVLEDDKNVPGSANFLFSLKPQQ